MKKNQELVNNSDQPKILFIDACNFVNYPLGGTLSFAKQMMDSFKDQLVLVGLTTDDLTPVGKWIKLRINNVSYDFFAIRKVKIGSKKPFIPERLKSYFALLIHKKKIRAFRLNIKNVFIESPDALLAIKDWGYPNICFRSPGVVNMLVASRFWYAKYFATLSQKFIYKALKKVNKIFASADNKAIESFVEKSKNTISAVDIIQFPTRVDTSIFKPIGKIACREKLNLATNSIIIVSTGRLGEYKGWKFMIDCFTEFNKIKKDSVFFLLGEGEDRAKIESYINKLELKNKIFITGSLTHTQIADYLNAADIFIMGSYVEGWATSLMEAVNCSKPVCVTDFGSASDMVENGKNGFVVLDRNEKEFVEKMLACLRLDELELAKKQKYFSHFSLDNLKEDILAHWQLY